MPTHGEYVRGRGFYSEVTKAWHASQGSIGNVSAVNGPALEAARAEMERNATRRNTFKVQPQLERMITLRNSKDERDKAFITERQREAFAQTIDSNRSALAMYETAKADAIASGKTISEE